MNTLFLLRTLAVAAVLAAGGCSQSETGPVRVTAVGEPPAIVNPNLRRLDAASAFLLEAIAQGLVRFDAAGEIEPALAQSWIVSDDGLRYTFRIRRANWSDGSRVTAEQVTARLKAAFSRASRSPLKPVLGAIAEVEAMTDQVLEISLRGPRPNLLQILAQPEMALIHEGRGTGPYAVEEVEEGALRLSVPVPEEEEEEEAANRLPDILLRGEDAATGIARFTRDGADLFTGGTVGNLPIARAADVAAARLAFDPAAGLFGLAFTGGEGPLADAAVRRAMSMAIDRRTLISALAIPDLQARTSLLPAIADDLPRPATPDWTGSPLPMRRELATRIIGGLDEPLSIRVAMPEGAGYRIVFAHLRRDWRMIGIEAEKVGPDEQADLRMIDSVAPGQISTWYFRHFTCEVSRVCDPLVDEALAAARNAPTPAQRRTSLAAADRMLMELAPFIALSAPIRWSLVSQRLTGFRPNVFAHHPAGTLIAEE